MSKHAFFEYKAKLISAPHTEEQGELIHRRCITLGRRQRGIAGNVYQLAAAPTQTSADGGLSLSIYYAKNVASSGANTVTVTFSQTAQYPDIRILEYSGIDQVNPVDVIAGQTQSSGATSDSGVVATTNPTDLLVGANIVQTFTAAAGATFAERVHSEPDGQIA